MTTRNQKNETRLLDLYYKKTATANWAGKSAAFDIPLTGFSSYQLDHGTLRLLRQIDAEKPAYDQALDLGCGYGPISIFLSVTRSAAQVTGIDRDALAVAFARRNAEKNGLANCEFLGGLAYTDLPPAKKYDAIISNIPAKAGEPVHREMLLGASRHLNPQGQVWIVVVTPLEAEIDNILADKAVNITKKVRQEGHIIYRYKFRKPVPAAPWPYGRKTTTFKWQKCAYQIDAAFGLPEFDSLSWDTELIFKFLDDRKTRLRFNRIVVCDPGQGHIPVFLHRLTNAVKEINLISRDALTLRQTALNLQANGFPAAVNPYHTVAFTNPQIAADIDLCVGVLDDKEGLEINVEKINQAWAAYPSATFAWACPITFGQRLAAALRKSNVPANLTRRHKHNCLIQCEG